MWVKACLIYLASSLAAQAAPTVWDFESGSQGWKPRAATVKVGRFTESGATAGSRACLRVHGCMEGNWNYAVSDSVPLQVGQFYRFSAWVKVISIGATTPMPFLKCEFVATDRRREMGRAGTDSYDVASHGQWQHLTAEFQVPAGTVSGWLALEKGTSDPTQIDAYLDDVILEPI
jgi:Carbohydrate binding domain